MAVKKILAFSSTAVLYLALSIVLVVSTASAAPNRSTATYLWHTFYATPAEEYGGAIAADNDGGIYVATIGAANWQGDGGVNPIHPYAGQDDALVVKLDHNGAYQWHTFYGTTEPDGAGGVAVDAQGNVYITGGSYQTWLGDNGAKPLHTGGNSFVLKLNRKGVYQWHTFYKMGMGPITVDSAGNVFVSGNSNAAWKGEGGTQPLHPFSGPSDLTVLKLDSQGKYQWHTFYGPAGAAGIAVGDDNNVYVSGNSGTNWLGNAGVSPLHTYTGGTDLTVLALTNDGAYRWHTFYGSASEDGAANLALDKQNHIYIAGASHDTWLGDGNKQPLAPHQGNYDTLLLKLTKNGAYQWHTFSGLALADENQHLALDGNGKPHVTYSNTNTTVGDSCPTSTIYCEYWRIYILAYSPAGLLENNYGLELVGDPGQYYFSPTGIATDLENNNYLLADSYGCQDGCINPTPLRAYSGGTDKLILKLNIAQPPAPSLLKPADKAMVLKARPSLVWGGAANATSYHIQLYQGSRKGTLIADTNVSVTRFKPPALVRGETYYWHVQACNDNGCSLWTKWWSFTVKMK